MYLFLELFFLDTPFYHLHSSTHSLASIHLYIVRLQPNCSTKLYLAIGQSLPEPGFWYHSIQPTCMIFQQTALWHGVERRRGPRVGSNLSIAGRPCCPSLGTWFKGKVIQTAGTVEKACYVFHKMFRSITEYLGPVAAG